MVDILSPEQFHAEVLDWIAANTAQRPAYAWYSTTFGPVPDDQELFDHFMSDLNSHQQQQFQEVVDLILEYTNVLTAWSAFAKQQEQFELGKKAIESLRSVRDLDSNRLSRIMSSMSKVEFTKAEKRFDAESSTAHYKLQKWAKDNPSVYHKLRT